MSPEWSTHSVSRIFWWQRVSTTEQEIYDANFWIGTLNPLDLSQAVDVQEKEVLSQKLNLVYQTRVEMDR